MIRRWKRGRGGERGEESRSKEEVRDGGREEGEMMERDGSFLNMLVICELGTTWNQSPERVSMKDCLGQTGQSAHPWTLSGVGRLSLKVGSTVPWPGALGCERVEKAGQHQACIHSLRSSLLLVWLRCDRSFDLPKMMNPNLELSTKINTFSSKWLLVEIFFTAIKIILEHRTYRRREVLMFTKKNK